MRGETANDEVKAASAILPAALALLAAFAIILTGLGRESLWNDEAWTAWAVRSPYVVETLARVRDDVHPPLYFLLLDGWTLAAGESVYALRLPSAWFALVGLAAVYAIGRRCFGGAGGLIALILLATASFFVYYAREARMYSLLLALSALATWVYILWRRQPTPRRALVYAALLAALLYTHYAGALVVAAQVIHLVLTPIFSLHFPPVRRNREPVRWRELFHAVLPYALALAAFAPWLPAALAQLRANPNGPLAVPVPTNAGTVAALLLLVTGGYGGLWLAVLLWGALRFERHQREVVALLIFGLVLPPVALLALNAWVAPVYQVRYTITLLPAGALLAAYALRRLRLPGIGSRPAVTLQVLSAAVLVYLQLAAYPALWPGKPNWEAALRQMIAVRLPLEPTMTDFAPYSPAAYYARQLPVRQGISLDLSWRLHSIGELRDLAAVFDNLPSVWVALPTNTAKTWHLAALLDAGRGAGYRASLVNMIFYRFDRERAGDLRFRFGDRLRVVSGTSAAAQFDTERGDDVCVTFILETLAPLDGLYSAGLHLVDLSGTQSIAQQDIGLGIHDTGETVRFTPCLTIPTGAAPGYYHLELAVYNWSTGERLPVMEIGGGEGVAWGDVMRLAAVNVSE